MKFTEKAVSAYEAHEINALLAAADQEESELLQFFLFTGARDQEVQYATWRDINLTAKTFAVTEKLGLGFSPKDKEEGAIPIPDSLIDSLRTRRKKYPDRLTSGLLNPLLDYYTVIDRLGDNVCPHPAGPDAHYA